MGTVCHWKPFWSTTRVPYIGQCWYFNPQWTAGQARNKASCVANRITHWQNCAVAMCRHMNQGFWRGLGAGGDPFWLCRETLNFKCSVAYQNTAVFQTGVNTKFLQTSMTHCVTPLWVVRLFKWLTAQPLYGSFGVKGLNNATIPSDWKKALVVPIYKGGDRSAVTNYRPISLNSVVCKQVEHVIPGYLRQVWDKNDWLYEGQHGFTPGYSCESQVITVWQDKAGSLDEGVGIDAIIIDFSKAFDLVPHDWLLTKLAASGVDSRVVVWVREFLVGRT